MKSNEFIELIAPIIQEENKSRGYPLFNSVVIAQACLETGYGKSTLMMKANAIFGIKATGSWNRKTYSAKTREVYDGNPVTITDKFRAYDSIGESVFDYFELICKSERYRKALVTENPKDCITEIKKGGYATDPEYIEYIMNIINSNDLTKYDVKGTIDDNPYRKGYNYTTTVDLNVRNGAGTYFDRKKYSELTPNGKIHAYKQDYAVLKRGTIVTCLETKKVNSDIWLRIPSGWIAGLYGGVYYVR